MHRVELLTVINTALLIGLLVCVQLIVFISNTVNYLANDKLGMHLTFKTHVNFSCWQGSQEYWQLIGRQEMTLKYTWYMWSFREVNCDSVHCLVVAEFRERLSAGTQRTQKFDRGRSIWRNWKTRKSVNSIRLKSQRDLQLSRTEW